MKQTGTRRCRGSGPQEEIVRRVESLFGLADQIEARLAKAQTKVHALKRLQAETAAVLDALLPAILSEAVKGEL